MAEAKADLAKNNLSDSTDSQSSIEPSTSATKSNHQNTPITRTPANLKLPQFWKHNLESWISLIESQFRLGGIDSQITKCISTLKALNSSEIEQSCNIPSPEEPARYDKLIREIRNVFIVDKAKKLDILLNDLSLGDRSPNELMHQLIVASGTDENCSPQFETLLKDRFLKALPSEIAANSGTWTYTDLRSLANCATQAMTSSKRYGKSKVVLKIDKSEASDVEPKKFSQPRHNRKTWHSDKPNFLPQRFNNYQRKSNQKKQTWHWHLSAMPQNVLNCKSRQF